MLNEGQGFEWCPIEGWVAEIVTRMHEAHAAGSPVVNLSYTHPRGYIPTQIIRRPAVQKVLRGWSYTNQRAPETPNPTKIWLPRGWARADLDTCPLQPFVEEISRREAEVQGTTTPLDLTGWHPRGAIPPQIQARLDRRKSQLWQRETRERIAHLLGLANKDSSFAQVQRERMDSVEDPARLEAAAKELLARAEEYRAQAKWLTEELG